LSKGKILEGVVTADKSDKTVTVMVKIKVAHQMYKRARAQRKKYKVHDESNQAKIGDRVKIIESRPISKQKHFSLLEIVR